MITQVIEAKAGFSNRIKISGRRRKWLALKNRYAEQFELAGDHSTAEKLHACSETLALVLCKECSAKWYVLNKCRLRCCPLCSYQTARKRAIYIQALTQKIPDVKLLTLTMPKWQGNPREGIELLRENWNKLRRHKLFKSVRGGAYLIEVLTRPDGWHIHLHALLDCGYLPYQQIFSAWRSLFGRRHIEVDIRQAKTAEAKVYIAKEISKNFAIALDPAGIVEWYHAVKGSRLWITFGNWFNKTLEDLDAGETPERPQAVCPFCQAVGTCFFARDGPFVYGGDVWAQWGHSLLEGFDESIKAEIDWQE